MKELLIKATTILFVAVLLAVCEQTKADSITYFDDLGVEAR